MFLRENDRMVASPMGDQECRTPERLSDRGPGSTIGSTTASFKGNLDIMPMGSTNL